MSHSDLIGLFLFSAAGFINPQLAFFILLIGSTILTISLW